MMARPGRSGPAPAGGAWWGCPWRRCGAARGAPARPGPASARSRPPPPRGRCTRGRGGSALRGAWRRLAKAAGLERLRFHDLRHAHASLLLQQGVHPKIVSERLGHSGVNITLDTYSHVLPGLQAEPAARLDELLAQRWQPLRRFTPEWPRIVSLP